MASRPTAVAVSVAGRARRLRGPMAALAVALIVATVVVAAVPATRVAVVSQELRLTIELCRVAALLSAAGLLTVGGGVSSRGSFVAALVVLAGADLWFGIAPVLLTGEPVGFAGTFHPWLAARYVAGVLLVLAATQWGRRPTRSMLVRGLAAILLVELAVLAFSGSLPLPRRPAVDVLELDATHLALETVPFLLFGTGAVLAARLHAREGEPLQRWLALALVVSTFTQVHEVLFPAALGPVVTSADLLRALVAALLLVGAAAQVRRLVRDRNRALELLRQDLERSEQLVADLHAAADRERAFQDVVAHELATPLATIAAYTHVLDGSSPAAGADAVAAIRGEVERLQDLVDRVDDLRTLDEAGTGLERRAVAVLGLLEDAAAFARTLPGEHVVALDGTEARILADPTRLSQALRNVVANAARYAPPGSRIDLVGQPVDGRYVITVSDLGPGVVDDDADQLFAAYARGSAGRGRPGSGLGLHVARRIIQAHDGTITFVDAARPGGRVRITIGLAR